MKVKIMKCFDSAWWYSDCIGDICGIIGEGIVENYKNKNLLVYQMDTVFGNVSLQQCGLILQRDCKIIK